MSYSTELSRLWVTFNILQLLPHRARFRYQIEWVAKRTRRMTDHQELLTEQYGMRMKILLMMLDDLPSTGTTSRPHKEIIFTCALNCLMYSASLRARAWSLFEWQRTRFRAKSLCDLECSTRSTKLNPLKS